MSKQQWEIEEEMEEKIWELHEKSLPDNEVIEMREQFDYGWDADAKAFPDEEDC